MFKIIAFFMLFATLLTGFVLSKGNLALLWHPNELLMIFGPTVSCFIISNPMSVVKHTGSQLFGFFSDSYSKEFYRDSLLLMFDLTKLYKEKGNIDLEKHIEEPKESSIFQKYPKILKHTQSVEFICENLSLVTNGKYNPHDIDAYIDAEIEAYIAEDGMPSRALAQVADMLPSLGIVVAVSGIIITMQYIAGSAEEFASHISAALFGTFVGVFAAYGIVFPIANSLEGKTEKFKHYLEVLKSNIISIVHGHSPYVAMEIARKNIPPALRFSQSEVESIIRGTA